MAAIEFDNVSKKYKLYSKGGLYLRDRITHTLQRFNPLNGAQNSAHIGPQSLEKDFWALKNVTFEIKQGESVGFIGRNGAGKSTILKLLAGVTKPSSGKVTVNGRVAALIEVGAGFHPELTGRENIYLNGSILGMKKVELNKQFDSIVAFAELQDFIDTPVKHYSSGMYVRLGFAIAAHTNPDLFLIDEVLAVGDEAFQKKCLDTLKAHKEAGKTMILVSHNLDKVQEVCDRVIYMSHGEVRADDSPKEAIKVYMSDIGHSRSLGQDIKKLPLRSQYEWPDPASAPGNEKVRLHKVRLVCDGKVTADVDIAKDVCLEIEFWNMEPGSRISASIHLLNHLGVEVLASANWASANLDHDEWFGKALPVGLFQTTCVLPGNFLNECRYTINVLLLTDVNQIELSAKEVVSFQVHESGSMRKEYKGAWIGLVRPRLSWRTQHINCPQRVISKI